MKPPPASAGPVMVNTVPLFKENTIWYLNPRAFNTIGQSFTVDRPFRLSAVAPYVNLNITLLTPAGIQLADSPGGLSSPDLEAEQRPEHLEDWPFRVRLTVRIYRSSGPPPTQFDVTDGSWHLIAVREERRTAYTDQPLVTRFPNGPTLGQGNYLVTWSMEDVPKKILSITFSGTQEGRTGQLRNYRAGRAYIAYNNFGGTIFSEHTTKTLDAQSAGRNDWCRGDLQVWIMGQAVGPKELPTRGTLLSGGTRVEPYVPPVDVGKKCWSDPHTLQPRL